MIFYLFEFITHRDIYAIIEDWESRNVLLDRRDYVKMHNVLQVWENLKKLFHKHRKITS